MLGGLQAAQRSARSLTSGILHRLRHAADLYGGLPNTNHLWKTIQP